MILCSINTRQDQRRVRFLSLAIVAGLFQKTCCEICLTPLSDDEPWCSRSTVLSPWSTTHCGGYSQASSSYAGPTGSQDITAEHLDLPQVPISLLFSARCHDGGIAVWTSLFDGSIVKIDHDKFDLIDHYNPQEREEDPPLMPGLGQQTAAYNALDVDGHFFTAVVHRIEVYEDSIEGVCRSPIKLLKRFYLPDERFCRKNDFLVALTLTFNDHIAFVTKHAVVGVLPRNPDEMTTANLKTYSINDMDCSNTDIGTGALESVSNSIAVDETGGIYVVTSKAMYKFYFGGGINSDVELVWWANYNLGHAGGGSTVRIGDGSGSTPSLMGTKTDDDKFVVITDAQDLMHLVLMWRDDIPHDWPGYPGKDRRIACEIPVNFGDRSATSSLSEQSVLVRGYSAVLTNNHLPEDIPHFDFFPSMNKFLALVEGGNPAKAPYGIERIDWDPDTRTCSRVWVNDEVSSPNGIPTMSQATGLIYAIGQRDGIWGLEALDFETGESAFFAAGSATTCSSQVRNYLGSVAWLILSILMYRFPGSCENSFYAATEVGPDGSIYTGTLLGVSKYYPPEEEVYVVPSIQLADAGVRQGIDLCKMALAADLNVGTLHEISERAIVQLEASLDAMNKAHNDKETFSEKDRRIIKERKKDLEKALEILQDVEIPTDLLPQGGSGAFSNDTSWKRPFEEAQIYLEAVDDMSAS